MNDTIAAIATGSGRAGVGIVRISGPDAPRLAHASLGRTLKPRIATYTPFLGEAAEVLDVGIALGFVAPDSFTGEHVLELQGHGGPVVLDRLTTPSGAGAGSATVASRGGSEKAS